MNNGIGNNATLTFSLSNRINNFEVQGKGVNLSARLYEQFHIKVKPHLYDGMTYTDEYITQFNIIAEINQWSSDMGALHLASSLTGTARSLLCEFDSEHSSSF